MKIFFYSLIIILLFSFYAFAQMPTDALMMKEGEICVATFYTHSQWNHYWEGMLKRDNPNIGYLVNQNISLMAVYGVFDKLNVGVNLPYVWTEASSGQLAGQQGLQDFSMWVKYRAIRLKKGKTSLSFFPVAGFSVPVSNYIADFMPLSIGLRAKTATIRLVSDVRLEHGWFLTFNMGFTHRSNIFIDRDAYQFDGQLYYTNEVPVPNLADLSGRIGYQKDKLQAEFWFEHTKSLKGDDIRYNDMPFPTNRMTGTSLGIFAKYYVYNGLAINVNVGKVVSGRNIGQSSVWMAGVSYFFPLFKTINQNSH